MAAPEVEGRVFYNDTMSGFNFVRNRLPITAIAEQVLRYSTFARAPAVAAQSALIPDCLPRFPPQNRPPLLPPPAPPRIRPGKAGTTPPHPHHSHNSHSAPPPP